MKTKELSPYERWMVKSNLQTIREQGVPVADQVALLRHNGYPHIADAVQAEYDRQATGVLKTKGTKQ